MKPTIATIHQRRSVRCYSPAPVPEGLIDQIITAGKMAPSAVNAQPWKFYVANNATIIKQLSGAIAAAAEQYAYLTHGVHLSQPADRIFFGAPVVIFVTAPRKNEWAQLDIGMCVQNMMLAATALGLASCPIGFGRLIEKTSSYARFNIPVTDEVIIAVALGYGLDMPHTEQRKQDDVFYVT